MKHNNRFSIGDLLGGFSGAAVALPQAIGLGVVLFSTMGLSASSGALAGLLGAIILQLVVGGVGATIGIISAPNGPMTMLLVGVMEGMAVQGEQSEAMLLTLSVILILTGIFQILFALAGGTRLIKYIPYPVIAGLIAGVGILMVLSQWDLLAKEWSGSLLPHTVQGAFGLIIALITVMCMVVIPKWTQGKVPGAVAGLVSGIASYFILLALMPVEVKQSWVVGEIPSAESLNFVFSLEEASHLPLMTIVSAALALMILGTIDSLVTSLVADSKTGKRHDSAKEIVSQGSSQILIGLAGGLGGWGTKGATLVSTDAGGRRWAPLVSGFLFLILFLVAGSAGKYLPVSVLAGIVAMVGVGMIDLNIVTWFRSKEMRQDGIVALLVVVVTLVSSLIVAVGVGVVVSILIYLYKDAKRPIVHRIVTGEAHRSSCNYPEEAENILLSHGDKIILYELRGDLFFGTADRLRSELEKELKSGNILILHFRRVDSIDMSAMVVLLQLGEEARKEGVELVYCHLHHGLGFGDKIEKAFQEIDRRYCFENRILPDSDSAFEYAERKILTRYGYILAEDKPIGIAENNLCKYLNNVQKMLIEDLGRRVHFGDQNTIYRKDTASESLYLVLKGAVELRLSIGENRYRRIVKYQAGAYFGELVFIRPGKTEADAVAIGEVELFEIRRSDLQRLNEKELADLALALLYEFSQSMIGMLHFSAKEIKRLEAW
jgi:SulP family sulfate permease